MTERPSDSFGPLKLVVMTDANPKTRDHIHESDILQSVNKSLLYLMNNCCGRTVA
jgi:hypothetical protein